MTKTKISKVWNKQAEHYQEHRFWNYEVAYVGRAGERGLSATMDALVRSYRSLCGGIDDSQPVEMYDGSLGVTQDFVGRHQATVGQVQWKGDLRQHFDDPGNVAGKRWGSGILIGRDLFLTAAHAFEQPKQHWRLPRRPGSNAPITADEAARHQQVNFNYQINRFGQLQPEKSFDILELLEYRRGGLDFAIVRLAGAPGDQFGFAAISGRDAAEGDMLCIIQHPEGQPKRIDAGPLFHLHDDRISYDTIDTLAGSSGSGILQGATGLLVGVHTNGGCDQQAIGHNYGVRIGALVRESTILKELLRSSWRRENLSTLTGAPQLKGDPAGAWPFLVYRGHHGSVQRLWFDGEQWQVLNLTALTGSPPVQGTPAVWSDGEQARVFYQGRDQRLHLLEFLGFATGWTFTDLSQKHNLPKLDGDPVVLSAASGLLVGFLANDGHLHELQWQDRQWTGPVSPSRLSGAPPAREALQGLATGMAHQWVYYDRKGQWRLLRKAGNWGHVSLGEASGPKGKPAFWQNPGEEALQLLYAGKKGELTLLREADQWRPLELNQLPAADSALAYLPVDGAPHLLYRDRDDHLHLLRPDGHRWIHARLTVEAGAPKAKGDPAAVIRDGQLQIVYRTRDKQLFRLWKG